jgi:porphobilinogen deaminase
MYRQARDRQSARGAANMHDPYVNNATTNVPPSSARAFVARLGGGCSVPAGALCTRDGDSLHMRAWWDGSGRSADLHGDAGDPAGLGARAAEEVGAA